MKDKTGIVMLVVIFLAVCAAIFFGEQIMELLAMRMMEQTESLVDQLLR